MADAEIEITQSTLIIRLAGLQRLGAFVSSPGRLEIPLAHVVDAKMADREIWEMLGVSHLEFGLSPGELSWESGGEYGRRLYIPEEPDRQAEGILFGRFPYTTESRTARHAYVFTHDKRKGIVITLTDEANTLLVISVNDPAATVARIREAARARNLGPENQDGLPRVRTTHQWGGRRSASIRLWGKKDS